MHAGVGHSDVVVLASTYLSPPAELCGAQAILVRRPAGNALCGRETLRKVLDACKGVQFQAFFESHVDKLFKGR